MTVTVLTISLARCHVHPSRQMASLEGWSDVMHSAQAAVGVGTQPEANANKFIAIFFILFIVFGAFFMLNLVIGAYR
jgi:hypothetical protein